MVKKKAASKKTIRINTVQKEACDLEGLFDELDSSLEKLQMKLVFDRHVTTPLIKKSLLQLHEIRLSACDLKMLCSEETDGK